MALPLFAQESKPSVEVHGFVRNYYAVDSHEMVALTEDFFTYVPRDGEKYEYVNSRFAALTSRLWVEAKGYEFEGIKMGARIEADFYNGLGADKVTGTANLRLRQAFVTLEKDKWSLKAGQVWHPLAADLPDVFSLNVGTPFNAFSRTPLLQYEYKAAPALTLTAMAIWQMQYASNGPAGKSASYIKWGNTPEFYAGVNVTSGGFLMRLGVNVLSIKPRLYDAAGKFTSDRITTMSPFLYIQWKKDAFSVKFKSIFAEAGEHINLNGGYGISAINPDGSYAYTPSRNSSNWLSLKYSPGKVDFIMFAGYVKNFGTKQALVMPAGATQESDYYWFSGNSFSNLNSMFRLTPAVVYNLGKLALGLEYELTSAEYGDKTQGLSLDSGLYEKDLHRVTNHRVQGMIKFTF